MNKLNNLEKQEKFFLDPISVGAGILLGRTKESIKIEVNNELENIVSNTNKQLVKIATESSVKSSTTILQEEITQIKNKASASNMFYASGITLLDGAQLNIKQTNEVRTIAEAVTNIVKNTDVINKITTNMTNDLLSIVNQNAALQNDITTSATAEKLKQNSGEVNKMVDTVGETIQGMTNPTDKEMTQIIKNTVKNNLSNYIEYNTDIKSYIETVINTEIEQKTLTECFNTNDAYNLISLTNITISGPESNFEAVQANILNNYFSCIIQSTMTSKVDQDIAVDLLNKVTMKTDQGIDVKNKLSTTTSISVKDIATSFMDNIMFIVIALAVVGAIAAFAKMKKKEKKPITPKDIIDPNNLNNIDPGNLNNTDPGNLNTNAASVPKKIWNPFGKKTKMSNKPL